MHAWSAQHYQVIHMLSNFHFTQQKLAQFQNMWHNKCRKKKLPIFSLFVIGMKKETKTLCSIHYDWLRWMELRMISKWPMLEIHQVPNHIDRNSLTAVYENGLQDTSMWMRFTGLETITLHSQVTMWALLSHQMLNPDLLLKFEFIFLFALCSQSLPFTFSKQRSEFPRQLGEVPPTQILFYSRQTDQHFYSTI